MQNTYITRRRTHYAPLTFAAIAAMLMIAAAAFFGRNPNNAATLFLQSATETPASEAIYLDIVVANQPIESGSVIGIEDVRMMRWPDEAVPFNALTSLDAAIGRIARTSIPCGAPILRNTLVRNARDVVSIVPSTYGSCPNGYLSPLPDPVEYSEVVIALQDIPYGSVISANAVASRPYPTQLVPADAVIGSPQDVAGQIAQTDIFREQVIQIPFIGSRSSAAILPDGMVAISLPIERLTSVAYAVQDGTRVDLIATLFLVELADGNKLLETTETPGAVPVTMRLASDALIVHIGSFPPVTAIGALPTTAPASGEATQRTPVPLSAGTDVITFAVTPQEAVILPWLIEARIPITLVLIPETAPFNRLDATITPPQIPDNMVAVAVPRTLVLAAPVGQLSDHVDIVATMRFADGDEEFQHLVPTGTPPDTQSVTQQVISNALQMPSDDPNMMTFVVSPQDAVVLSWLIEAHIPLIIVSPGSWPSGNIADDIPTITVP